MNKFLFVSIALLAFFVPIVHAAYWRGLSGQNDVNLNCGSTTAIIEGSGHGEAVISNARAVLVYEENERPDFKRRGSIHIDGFSSNSEYQGYRLLEGSGTLTFNGQNRVFVVEGEGNVRLSGNYRFAGIAAPVCLPKAIEPTP